MENPAPGRTGFVRRFVSAAVGLVSLALAAFGQAPAAPQTPPAPAAAQEPRLLCLYLDLTSLRSADLLTARNNAMDFVRQRTAPTDRIAVMTYTSKVNLLQDFTTDQDKLLAALQSIRPFDTSETDADRSRLEAIRAAAIALGKVPGKKALFYFSASGKFDKQTDVRSTTTALTQANVAIFPVEMGERMPNLR